MPGPSCEGHQRPPGCIFCAPEYGSDVVFDAISELVGMVLNDIPSFLPDEWMARAIQLRAKTIERVLHQTD